MLQKKRPGDIEINLQDSELSGRIIQSRDTDAVIEEWRKVYGAEIGEIRQKSTVRSSSSYEVVYVTPNPGVWASELTDGMKQIAKRVLAEPVPPRS